MEDLYVSIDMYRTGEYKPQDYEKELKDNGVLLDHYDYDKVFKNYLNTMNQDLVDFVRTKKRKIVTVIGSIKYIDEILEAYRKLTLKGYMVFIETIKEGLDLIDIEVIRALNKDKMLISDLVYVVNKNQDIDVITQADIDFAKEHKKQIEYLEPIEGKGNG